MNLFLETWPSDQCCRNVVLFSSLFLIWSDLRNQGHCWKLQSCPLYACTWIQWGHNYDIYHIINVAFIHRLACASGWTQSWIRADPMKMKQNIRNPAQTLHTGFFSCIQFVHRHPVVALFVSLLSVYVRSFHDLLQYFVFNSKIQYLWYMNHPDSKEAKVTGFISKCSLPLLLCFPSSVQMQEQYFLITISMLHL